MDTEDLFGSLAVLFLAFVIFISGLAIGATGARSGQQRAAISAGVAEWRCNAATGTTEFVWKKLEKEEPQQ